MKILSDLKELFTIITFIDVVFFFSVILLFILIIVLIYFIKINEDVYTDSIKTFKNKDELENINQDLNEISDKSEFTSYEEEQEKRAIISYDELKEIHKFNDLNYIEEKEVEGMSIKKINKDDMFKVNPDAVLYKKEEDYLKKLKGFEDKLKWLYEVLYWNIWM